MFFRFNLDGLLRGDYASRMSGYATGIQNGIFSVNDCRELENMDLLPESEGGFIHVLNGNVVRLRDAGAAYGVNGNTESAGKAGEKEAEEPNKEPPQEEETEQKNRRRKI